MHGDIPVIRPPRKPIKARVNIAHIRRRRGHGLVRETTIFATPTNVGRHGKQPCAGRLAVRCGECYWAGGISTVSIMYTVAFAVCTPPHTKPASLTLRSFPMPTTFTSAPCSVLCMPSTFAGLVCPCTTWKVRMLFNLSVFVLRSSSVAAGNLANASLVGANTVYWPLLRVSTRLTFGFNLPDSAEVKVDSSGLLDAAVATGSCAIPDTDAGSVGCSAA